MSPFALLLAACLTLAMVGTGSSVGQTPATPPQPEAATARATTTDLARAYLQLERAFFAAPVERELCREVNIAFDDASKLFFTGEFGRVVKIVNAQTAKLSAASELPAPHTPSVEPWKMDPKNIKAEGGGVTYSYDDGEFPFVALMIAEGLEKDPEIWSDHSVPSLIWEQRHGLVHGLIDCTNPIGNLVLSRQELAKQVYAEWSEIDKGRNPYTHHRGDLWRPFFIDDQPAPMRLFCPERREPPAAGWPLVIALHGAGGNEHMFFAAYGVGRIKQLAEQHGFVVACPQVSPLAAQPLILDALVDSIALDYPIDRSRIYLIGHSMGAGVALAWSKSRHEKIAASALIAGVGRFNARDRVPPTLLIAPELDGLIPAKSIIETGERARAAGLPVESREIKDYGHTLVVGHVLPEVVEWLLAHRSAPSPAAAGDGEKGTAP